MYPWLWFWAPQIHWPLSNFSQDVAPVTDWDFGAIPPWAGDGRIEREAVRVASYGRQLGLISELLLAQAGSDLIDRDKADLALRRLEDIYGRIEATKSALRGQNRDDLVRQLQILKGSDSAAFADVVRRVGASLSPA
jgi:hypothetical protein